MPTTAGERQSKTLDESVRPYVAEVSAGAVSNRVVSARSPSRVPWRGNRRNRFKTFSIGFDESRFNEFMGRDGREKSTTRIITRIVVRPDS